MKLRALVHFAAGVFRPLLGLLGVKSKTVAGKIPDLVEAVDRSLPPEQGGNPKKP